MTITCHCVVSLQPLKGKCEHNWFLIMRSTSLWVWVPHVSRFQCTFPRQGVSPIFQSGISGFPPLQAWQPWEKLTLTEQMKSCCQFKSSLEFMFIVWIVVRTCLLIIIYLFLYLYWYLDCLLPFFSISSLWHVHSI